MKFNYRMDLYLKFYYQNLYSDSLNFYFHIEDYYSIINTCKLEFLVQIFIIITYNPIGDWEFPELFLNSLILGDLFYGIPFNGTAP